MAVYEVFVTQMLVIDQSNSENNPRGVYATNTLVIAQLAKSHRQFVSAGNFLNVGQVVEARKSINHQTVNQFLEVRHGGHRAAGYQSVTQYLILGSLAKVVEYEAIQQTLSITQVAIGVRTRAGSHTLNITQSATANVVRNLVIAQTLIVHSGGVGVIEDEELYSISLPSLSGPNAPEVS